MSTPEAESELMHDLDRCVKCGMCLPECPTYRLEANENESPRGRLALIEGMVKGQIAVDDALLGHLDSCLACRRCERVCPSKVPYGRVIDAARNRLPRRTGQRLAGLLRHPQLLANGSRLARLVPEALSRPLGRIHQMHRLARVLAHDGRAPGAGDYPSTVAQRRGRVGLFAGCTGAAQQPGALAAAVRLLNATGFDVSIPKNAGCCGALSAHAGDSDGALALAATNRQAFGDAVDAVVSLASGCGIHLDDYDPPLAVPHADISAFLLQQAGLDALRFAPLDGCIALHTPCSIENVYRGGDWSRALLGRIPGVRLVDVGEAGQCCGAAGDHMLRRPQQAARLRQPLLDSLGGLRPTLIATGNVGCAMHLADGLRQHGIDTAIAHPIEILARQLES